MKRKLSEQEQEFFLTGAKTCLDILEALEEFRRQVQERCREIVKIRLKDLSVACQIEWDATDLRDFSETNNAGTNRSHYLGVRITIESVCDLFFYLGMNRDDEKLNFETWIQMWRRQSVASELWTMTENADEYNSSSLWFGSERPEEHLSNFEEHLNLAINRFVDLITKAGRLKRYLPQPT